MKISTKGSAVRRRQDGMAVIVVIALIAILFVYVAGNVRTLYLLARDVKLVEEKQVRRITPMPGKTNAVEVKK
jgi:hypothetical protein